MMTETRLRRTTVALGLLGAGLLASCTEPLLPFRDDIQRTHESRLRDIGRLRLEDFARPRTDKPAVMDAAALTARFAGAEVVELSLEECRASALANNLDVRVALIAPTIAEQAVSQEEARFEAAFTTRALWAETDTPTASELTSAQSKVIQISPGVRIPLRTGGTASISLPMARSSNNNPFSTLNPAYRSDAEFSLSQPLLRGGGRRAATSAIRIARYNSQVSAGQAKLEAIRQLAAVDRSYWRLYQARQVLEVRQRQYELAQNQLERAERRVQAGAAAEIEEVRAQAGVARTLEAIIIAQNALLAQQRELKRIVNLPGLTIDTLSMVVPGTEPDPVEYLVDRGEVLLHALDNRMELLQLELQLAADAALIHAEKNSALPLFTMDYAYRINGLGASAQDSAYVLTRNNYEDWSIGLTAEVPFGNEAAKSRVRRAVLQRLQRLATREARELAIRQEVLNAVDEIEAGWQRILAARQSVILNARALQAEQRQFDVGAGTSTNVLDASTRLAEAQLAEIQAVVDYQVAQVDLAFATGTLLGAARVDFADAPDPSQKPPVEGLHERMKGPALGAGSASEARPEPPAPANVSGGDSNGGS